MEKKAIKVTDEVNGKMILEYFTSKGAINNSLKGNAKIGYYYGVINGVINLYNSYEIKEQGFEVIELPKKEEKNPDYYLYDVYLGEKVVVRGLKDEKVKIGYDDRIYFYLEDKVVASFTSSYSYVRRGNGKALNSGLADGDSVCTATSFHRVGGCTDRVIVGYLINGEPFFG